MAGEKILVVDDGKENREFVIEYVLKPAGFDAYQAKDGLEGLEAARRLLPDLILLDLQMPRLNGIQVLQALRNESLNIPVILMTFHGSEEIAIDVFRLGVRDYVKKPYTVDEMLRAIENCLSEVRMRREQEALTERLLQRNRALHGQVKELTTTGGPNAIPTVGQHREIGVLYASMRFARSFDDAPETLAAINAVLDILANTVQSRGGVVSAFSSEALMAIFNAPEPVEQFPLRTVEAALASLKGIRNIGRERGVACAIGVDCGDAIVGGLTISNQLSYSAAGEPIFNARRISEMTEAGKVLFSGAVAAYLRGRAPIEQVGTLALRSTQAPLPIFRLTTAQG